MIDRLSSLSPFFLHGSALAANGASFGEIFRALISIILLTASLFVLLSRRFKGKEKKWALGLIGAVIAFWFGGL